MSSKRYPEEFRIAAVRQITEGGYAVSDVASRLDVTTHSLYSWLKKYGPDSAAFQAKTAEQAEPHRVLRRLFKMREYQDEEHKQIFPGSQRTRCAHGIGAAQ